MNYTDAPSQSSAHAASYSASDTRLHGGLLVLARSVWILIVALTIGLFIAALPMLSRQLQTMCVSATACSSGQLSPTGLQTIHDLGFSVGGYAVYTLTLYIATSLVWYAVGIIIFWRKSDDWMALLVVLFLIMFNLIPSVGKSLPAFVYPVWNPPLKFLSFLAVIPLVLFFYLFPSGTFVPHWTRWFAVVNLALAIPRSFFPSSAFDFTTWPDGLNVLTVLSVVGTMLFAQVYRYRHVSDAVQRQQTKWVVFGVAAALVVLMAGTLYYLLFPTLTQSGSRYSFFFGTAIPLVLLAIPLSIGIAILRYRLWDIDLIINRTLVYGGLSACVIGLYVLIVGYLGALFRTPNNTVVALIATALVAIAFQPLRGLLQRAINRLMYGERDAPYQVLARLDQQLARALPPEEVLPALVKTIATILKLPYVAVALVQDDAPPLPEERLVAFYGQPSAHAQMSRLPLVYQGETVGQLVLAPRPGEVQLTRADRQLLEDLARHAGVIAHAVRLTSDLRRSRERIVVAREEERRRLRRDLHDGLGPLLASLTLTLAAAREYLPHNPVTTDSLLQELATQVQGAVADIRRLVYELRPPALDDLGLVGALRDQAVRSTQGDLQVNVEAPTEVHPLPAAVEVAAYRIGVEALTNVVRHAQASNCTIVLRRERDLVIEITDDGRGLPIETTRGIGLRSMRERAEELGGRCVIASRPEGGTQVVVHLPLAGEREGSNGAGD